MDLRQLRAFIAVFEERNITGAAQRLSITQPSLSVTIRQLEDALGTVLFMRQPRGVGVSADARVRYPQARRMVTEANALSRQFRHREERLQLTLGVESDIAGSGLEGFLGRLREILPHVGVTLQLGCGGDARLDIDEKCCEDELFVPLWDEPFVLTLPAGHALASKAAIHGDHLVDAHWITCPGHSSHQRLIEVYGDRGDAPAAQAGSLSLALQLVAAGNGIAMLPRQLTERNARVVTRPLLLPQLARRIGLCYATQALSHPALRVLVEDLDPASCRVI